MPGDVPPVTNEREGLLGFLAQQRDAIRFSAYGLTDDQARATPTPSGLSVGGLVKHLAHIEREWMNTTLQRRSGPEVDYEANFRLAPDETLAGALHQYAQSAAATDAIVAELELDHRVPVPPGVPWFPDDVDAWSLRWVLFHLIEETARHAGHADIVREALDGATAIALMAAAEGWTATAWVQPWSPP